MGGLARRVSYANALSSQVNGEVPIVEVDAGNFLSDEINYKAAAEDPRIKNEWVLRAFDNYHVAAANVSQRDLPYLTELMASTAYKENLKRYPFLSRIVSANVTPASAAVQPFKPYVVEEIRGKRLGAKPLRVGIVGVSEKPAVAGSPTSGYTISDPVEAAKRVVPELRKTCDLVVVLAYADRDVAKRIGSEAPGIDIIIAAHQFPLFNSVDEAGDAVVAMVASQTKWLGELRLYTSKDSKGPAISNYLHRDVPLDQVIPDDAGAAKLVQGARAAFQKLPPAPPSPAARSSTH